MICANTEARHRYDREQSELSQQWEALLEQGHWQGSCYRAEVQAMVNFAAVLNEDLFDIAIEQLEAKDQVWACVLNDYCVDTLPHNADRLIEAYAEKYAQLKI